MSKPSREECLKMAKEAGFGETKRGIKQASTSDIERLIHAAFAAGEQSAARECYRICTDGSTDIRRHEFADRIAARFSLTPQDKDNTREQEKSE